MVLLSGKLIWSPFILFALFQAYKKLGKKGFGLFFLFWLLTLVASDVTASSLFKNIFLRPRPCKEDDLEKLIYHFGQKCGGRYGFISSHAANSFGLITFYLGILNPQSKWKYSLWLIPVAVSFSRIYLGVHYPSDLIIGAIVGITWANALIFTFKNSLWGQAGHSPNPI
ncbi:MAG: phosphatase PAP2 family protein [Bacteriovoracaceae bacterium]